MKKSLRVFIIMIILLLPLESFASEEITRIAGTNRFETAVEVSKASYEKSDVVVLVSDKGQVDSLTGTILTYNKNAPMLLIKKDEIPKSIMNEIKRLNVKEVYLLGGESVISKKVENSLKDYKVTRIHGSNRYKTAIEIAKMFDSDEYFVVSGEAMADALSIGPISAQRQMPILLTGKSLPQETLDFIKKNNPDKVIIIGGNNAVSLKIEKELKDITNVERIYGKNRIETSLRIAERFYNEIESVTLSNSHILTDALIGGQLAAKSNSPIILTNDKINNDVKDFIKSNNLSINVLGGNEVVKDEVVYGLKDIKFLPSIKDKKSLEKYITEKVETRTDRIIVKYYGNDIKNNEHAKEVMRIIRNNQGYHQANGGTFWTSVTQKDGYVEIDYLTEYRTSDEEERFIDKEVDRIIKKYIKPGMKEIDKVRTLHDYLVNNTTYSLETKGSPYNAYTVFKESKGVCNGYVLAFMKLMDAINVETLYVMGTAENENGLHAWNKIKVDNVWYNIDVTWAHPAEKYGLHNAYKYFLNSDKRFYKNHTPTSMRGLPRSLDTKYDGQYDGNFNKKDSLLLSESFLI